MIYSAEQANIIELCKQGQNVIVDAVAGSGKTTTLLGIAAASDEQMLGVLYNRSLKEETRLKVQAANLHALEIHNYHALARRYYDKECCNDTGLTKILNTNKPLIRKLPSWKRIILDEVQDMSPLYYRLIIKIIVDLNNPDLRLTVMGDHLQAIFAFLKADCRFLTLAAQIFKPVTGPWIKASLSTTYRCSSAICSFMNEGLLGYKRMVPVDTSPSPPVHYVYGSPFDAHKVLTRYITAFLTPTYGYKAEDIFVLAPSVASKGKTTPVSLLENALVSRGIPVYVSNEREAELSTSAESPIHGKLVITTYHQSKGLERAVVIVYSCDDSYYDYRDDDRNLLSSPMYVAMTRAKKYLFVLHDNKKPPLRFFKKPTTDCVVYMDTNGTILPNLPVGKTISTVVPTNARVFLASEITNYLPADTLLKVRDYLTIQTLKDPYMKIPLISTIQTSLNTFETVSDLNGVAIPALYEWQHKKAMRITSLPTDQVVKDGPSFVGRYTELQRTIAKSDQEPKIDLILEAANLFNAICSGYHYKVAQINNYAWLIREQVEPSLAILKDELGHDDVQYEVEMPEQVYVGAAIRGRVDAYSEAKSTLWEIKCTDTMDISHEIQTAIYAWMFMRAYPRRFQSVSFMLLNIRTGESRRLHASANNLNEMMAFLIQEKMAKSAKTTDEQFIAEFSTNNEPPSVAPVEIKVANMVTPAPMFIDDAPPPPTVQEEPAPEEEAPTQRVVVFDLETTGLPQTPSFGKYYPPSELSRYNASRIVQWSWSLHEADGTQLEEQDHIVKHNTAEYRIQNQQFHGITDAIATARGKPFETILELWLAALNQADVIVGHNVGFDRHVLLSELHRRGHLTVAALMETKQWVCTMERAKELCGLKARNKLKPPKLCELMHALGVTEETGRAFHNSKHDVYYTAKCYFAEQVLVNPCPIMYEGKHAGKTYEYILQHDRPYAVHSHAVCNVRKLYTSPLRKLSNWLKLRVATDPTLAAEVKVQEEAIRNVAPA
jgi:DNA polymerase III epsilon subunit-like protein